MCTSIFRVGWSTLDAHSLCCHVIIYDFFKIEDWKKIDIQWKSLVEDDECDSHAIDCWIFTIITKGPLTFDHLSTPARCARHSSNSMLIFNLGYIKFEWVFAAAELTARSTLVTSPKSTWNLKKKKTPKSGNQPENEYALRITQIVTHSFIDKKPQQQHQRLSQKQWRAHNQQ